jgi:small subunit ribosomal protein S6
MEFYETIFILGSAPDAIDAEIQKVVDLITANKGQVVHIDRWGMKKFAYEIRKKEQGYYTCVYFKGDKSLPAHLESYYKLNESCLRYLTVVSIHTPEEIAARAEKVEARPAIKAAAAPKPTAKKVEEKPVPEKEKAKEPSEEEAETTEPPAEQTKEAPEGDEKTETPVEKTEEMPSKAEAAEKKEPAQQAESVGETATEKESSVETVETKGKKKKEEDKTSESSSE